MHRIILSVLLLTLLGWGLPAYAQKSPVTADRPNIIFILVDDLGWGDLGVFHQNGLQGRKRHQTPELDRFANEGLQLRAHYCPAPVCAPSRASLLTGVHQGHAVVRDNQFDKALEDNHTLASVLKTAGYTTAIIGKYGLQGEGSDPQSWPAYPTKRGFDEFFGYVRHRDGHQHYPANEWPLGNSPGHRSPQELWHNEREVSEELDKCYTTDLFTARAKHWITKQVRREDAQPFFLYLAYDTPHAALQLPTVPFPEGKGVNGGLRWLGQPGKMINTAVGEIDAYRHPDYVGNGWSDEQERFATMVRRIDQCIGDLLQTLRDLRIQDNTLIVFTSDNGPHHESYLANSNYDPTSFQSYGPFDGTKRDTWEGGVRMPTLVWGPGVVSGGRVISRPSQFHDWLPTFAELAGSVPPARTDGVSLVPTLTGRGQQVPSTIYIEYAQNGRTKAYDDFEPRKRGRRRGQMQVVHVDGYKGVRVDVQDAEDPFEIYDLQADPSELKNLADSSEAFRRLERRMRARVLQLRIRNASAPRPYDEALVPAVEGVETHAGWLVSTFSGDFPYVPQLVGREAEKQVLIDSLSDLTAVPHTDAVQITGWIEIEQPGEYRFDFESSQSGLIRIHDANVIDADYGFRSGQSYSGSMKLAAGKHPVRLTLLGNEQDWRVRFQWTAEGADH